MYVRIHNSIYLLGHFLATTSSFADIGRGTGIISYDSLKYCLKYWLYGQNEVSARSVYFYLVKYGESSWVTLVAIFDQVWRFVRTTVNSTVVCLDSKSMGILKVKWHGLCGNWWGALHGLVTESGPWFHLKMPYQYRKPHCGDMTVVKSSYL